MPTNDEARETDDVEHDPHDSGRLTRIDEWVRVYQPVAAGRGRTGGHETSVSSRNASALAGDLEHCSVSIVVQAQRQSRESYSLCGHAQSRRTDR